MIRTNEKWQLGFGGHIGRSLLHGANRFQNYGVAGNGWPVIVRETRVGASETGSAVDPQLANYFAEAGIGPLKREECDLIRFACANGNRIRSVTVASL